MRMLIISFMSFICNDKSDNECLCFKEIPINIGLFHYIISNLVVMKYIIFYRLRY